MKKLLVLFMFAGISISVLAQETKDVFTHKFGTAEISLLSEAQQQARPNILINATPEMLSKYAPNGTFPNAMNAFLLRADKNILIDAGLGSKLFENLQSLAVSAEQVHIVLITHMHGDHIGGLLREGKATFPNAEVYLAQSEHDYWMNNGDRGRQAREVIALYKDRLHLFQPDELDAKVNEIIPGIQAIAAYGHTPGHTIFMLTSGKEKLLVWGDLTHAMAIQMPYPQVSVTYDVDPALAAASRQKVLEYVTKNSIPVAGMHVAFPGMGNLTKSEEGGYIFRELK